MTCRVRVRSKLTGEILDGELSDEPIDGWPVLRIGGQVADCHLFQFLTAEVVREA